MRLVCFGVVVLLVAVALPAHADLLRSKRASVMCSSASALAKLALPGGGSRTTGNHVSPGVAAIAQAGNCIDFPESTTVIVLKARTQTSTVRTDSRSGDGVMVDVLVANVDFDSYTPPHNAFYDTIRARCPSLLDAVAAEDPPSGQFTDTLAPSPRASIQRVLQDNCGEDGVCQERNRAAEIGRRNLTGQWAAFLCAHPTLAVEPVDRSAGPVRD